MKSDQCELSFVWKDKRVLFVTTKSSDYIRNSQEIDILEKEAAEVEVLESKGRYYPLRMLDLYCKLLFKRMGAYDVVFVGFSPQLIVPWFFWKMQKTIVVSDFFISTFDTFVNDRKKFTESSLIAKLLHYMDDRTVACSQYLIADTKAHAQYFSQEFGADLVRTEVLYLHADEQIYYPREAQKPREWKNKYVVLYFGSVLPLQGVDVVMEAAGLCEDLTEQLQFVLIGPVNKRYQRVEKPYIEYIDWLSQDKLAEYISCADLCLAGHFNGEIDKAKRTIPGKAYIYEMMKKIMILGDSAANHERYSEDQTGIYFVPMGDAGALADKIKEIYAQST